MSMCRCGFSGSGPVVAIVRIPKHVLHEWDVLETVNEADLRQDPNLGEFDLARQEASRSGKPMEFTAGARAYALSRYGAIDATRSLTEDKLDYFARNGVPYGYDDPRPRLRAVLRGLVRVEAELRASLAEG